MLNPDRHPVPFCDRLWLSRSCRPAVSAVCLTACALGCMAAGCSSWPSGHGGFSNPGLMQIQFYAPPGAEVTMHKSGGSGLQVASYESDHRLEHAHQKYAIFNLSPRAEHYEFMYTDAEGFPDVSIYGELEVHKPETTEAKRFMRRAFIPIALHSRHHDRDDGHLYPVRGPSGVGLSQLETEHLRLGDMITKVYFVADLQKARETIRLIDFHIAKLDSAETVLDAHMEWIDSRYLSYRRESLYSDPTYDVLARSRDDSGFNKRYIKLEAERQKLENQRYEIRSQTDDLLYERRIRTRLLDTMKIINRRGALVLATPESQWLYHDATEQVSTAREYAGYTTGPFKDYTTGDIVIPRLGDVMVVMRVGGRHMHWNGPPSGMVAQAPEPMADEHTTIQHRESVHESSPQMVVE